MSISADLSELRGIEHDIKRMNGELKKLRKRKKDLETNIAAYIKSKDLPGVKHHGTAVLLEEKVKKASKSNKDRDRDAMNVLQQYGIQESPEKVLKEILKARQGEDVIIDKIKMKKYKRKDG